MNTIGNKKRSPNPRVKANWLSKLTHWYMNDLFKKGFRGELGIQDMYEVEEYYSSEKMYDRLSSAWEKQQKRKEQGSKSSLLRAIISISWKDFFTMGISGLLEEAGRVTMPYLLGLLLLFFGPDNKSVSPTEAYIYAAGIALSSLLAAIAHHPFFFRAHMVGLQLRAACCSLIYKKVLSLNPSILSRVTTGHVTNLISTDCQIILMAPTFLTFLWLGPVELGVVAYLLYCLVGLSSFAGIGLLLFLVPLHVGNGKIFAYLRRKIAALTDKRVNIMNEVIAAMRVIKMYTWEISFARLVSEARRKEVQKILKVSSIRAMTLSFPHCIPSLAALATFSVHYLRGQPLILAEVLSSVALLNVLRISVVFFIPLAIQQAMEGYVAIKRIQRFLEIEELPAPSQISPDSKKDIGVTLSQFTASWEKGSKEKVLKNITLEANAKNNFSMVIGPVGSGKSSLFAAILGELEDVVGTASVRGKIAYASQQAWIFSGTVRENILFGKPLCLEKYRKVLHACALDEDLTQLPKADSTLVGERGVSLSGGQKARVSLARAVYHDADIYLLDDPMSAVDAKVGRHIFEQCFCGLLKNKIRILVTHQLQYLGDATEVLCLKEAICLVMTAVSTIDGLLLVSFVLMCGYSEHELSKGKVLSRGTYAELLANGLEVGSLISDEDSGAEDDRDSAIDTDEVRSGVYGHPVLRYRGVSKSSSVSSLDLPVSRKRAISESSLSPHHVNLAYLQEDSVEEEFELLENDENAKEGEKTAKGGIKASVYLEYLSAGISAFGVLLLFLLALVTEFVIFLSNWWLAYWADNEEKRRSLQPNETLSVQFYSTANLDANFYMFIGVSITSFVMVTVRAVLIFLTLVIASRVLHDRMFQAILKAPIYFFDTNPVGRILNRFSKDVYFMDDELPMTFLDFIQNFLSTLATLIVNVVSIPYILLVIAPLSVIFFVTRMYYVRTSREVKRLEAISRSPMFSHLSATLQGLSSIRAYGAQEALAKEFYACQDHQSEGWFLFLASSRWFGIRLDTLAALFVSFAVFAPLVLRDQIGADNAIVALALSYAITLMGAFQWCVRQSAQLENLMTSVERVVEYSKIPPEPDNGTSEEIDENWPKYGLITAELASYSYHESLPYVLKNLFFCIRANEKVGVVGRTGAGKSSLISMLFRMAHIGGTVRIDGVSTADIKLEDLRSRISVIPQDPVLFSGSLRRNLDPFDEYADADVWNALEEVQLKDVVYGLPNKLHTELTESGANFSVGQRQLLCLSRALLRKNKILVIDEATANVDQETDSLIQETIRYKFRNCTVITVAHRLNTVMDSDRVMVLSEGKVLEFDEPIELLRNTDSALRKLVDQTGKTTAAKLLLLAEEARDYRNMEREENQPNYPGRGITKSRTKDELLEMFGTRIVYETSL